MNKLFVGLSVALFGLFEIYAGVQVMNDPTGATQTVITIFGIALLIIGLISLIRAYQTKGEGILSKLALAAGIIDILVGIACVGFTSKVMDLVPPLIRIYGVIMVIMGLNKLRKYASLRKYGFRRSWIMLLSAILTIVLGVMIFTEPFAALAAAWTYVGISLIIEGVLDLLVLIFGLIFL